MKELSFDEFVVLTKEWCEYRKNELTYLRTTGVNWDDWAQVDLQAYLMKREYRVNRYDVFGSYEGKGLILNDHKKAGRILVRFRYFWMFDITRDITKLHEQIHPLCVNSPIKAIYMSFGGEAAYNTVKIHSLFEPSIIYYDGDLVCAHFKVPEFS